MTRQQVQHLGPGLYRVHWRNDDRPSLAAVGIDEAGLPWLAPTNWARPLVGGSPWWRMVGRMDRIK